MTNEDWNYFDKDPHYSDVLKERLASGVEMDSARALGVYLDQTCEGDLHMVDFGAGPGHYYPFLKRRYTKGRLHYLGIDIDVENVRYGANYFRDDEAVEMRVGSILAPEASAPFDSNCVISANTLPHVPTITPLLDLLVKRTNIRYFLFRMLVGSECVQIKKHLHEHQFEGMFERDFQYNNIYSLPYIQQRLGPAWDVRVEPDIFDRERLEQHRLPAQEANVFYANRVSRPVGSMVFKGDIYMPWKFVIGRRGNAASSE